MVWFLRQGLRWSQDLNLHSATQHRKAQNNIKPTITNLLRPKALHLLDRNSRHKVLLVKSRGISATGGLEGKLKKADGDDDANDDNHQEIVIYSTEYVKSIKLSFMSKKSSAM